MESGRKIPLEMLMQATEIGKTFPELGTVRFKEVDGGFVPIRMADTDGFLFRFWFTLMPMFVFEIPFTVDALESFRDMTTKVLEDYAEQKSKQADSPDSPMPGSTELPSD